MGLNNIFMLPIHALSQLQAQWLYTQILIILTNGQQCLHSWVLDNSDLSMGNTTASQLTLYILVDDWHFQTVQIINSINNLRPDKHSFLDGKSPFQCFLHVMEKWLIYTQKKKNDTWLLVKIKLHPEHWLIQTIINVSWWLFLHRLKYLSAFFNTKKNQHIFLDWSW